MKTLISRRFIIETILIAVLLGTLPNTLRRLIESGDLYLFTRRFFEDMLARFSGPGRLRFIVQPTVAVLLGARDGVRDVRVGHPFLQGLLFHKNLRQDSLRSAFRSIRELISIAILLDLISQFLIFRRIHPGAALFLGPVLIAVPYTVSRVLSGRTAGGRTIIRQ